MRVPNFRSPSLFETTKLALLAAGVTLAFQNCGLGGFKSADLGASSTATGAALCTPGVDCATAAPPTCSFNGQSYVPGAAATAYVSSTGACISESRVCQANGVMTGSYAFASCDPKPGAKAACLFDGRTILDGQPVTAFASGAVDDKGACTSETRTCADGALNGSFAFASCGTTGAAACAFNGKTIPNGQSIQAFATSTVPAGQSCAPQMRTCVNGALTGSGTSVTCVAGGARTCTFNDLTVVSGQSVPAYPSSSVPADQTCVPTSRLCTDGTLAGTGDFATCQVAGGAACRVDGQTVASGGSISLYLAPVVDPDQICTAETRACTNGTLSGSATYASCFARQRYISASYVPPTSKEGVTDVRYDDPNNILDARYAKFRQMGLGYKEYNLFWSRLETATVPSSPSPVNCPADTFMVPANESERVTWGFHKYRCLTTAQVAIFDNVLTRDAASGLQSGAVLWSAPAAYRYPGCLGSNFAGNLLTDGCVPRDDAMDDYEDYVTFLANRYNGRNGHGKLAHYIVWNENASAVWFDYSPVVNTRGPVSATDVAKWTAKYAQLMARTHDAVQRNSAGVMIDVSTDLFWTPPKVAATAPSHIGNQTLVDGVWQALGARYSWSVAVHPYGDLNVVPAAGRYSFLNVETIAAYQSAKLQALGLPATSLTYPQAYLIASEQGWPQSKGIAVQAVNICRAQALSLQVPTLLTQAHNYFQSTEPQETQGGSSNQGAFYGLIPYAAPIDLSNVETYATGAAYLATSAAVWGQSSGNYCCQQAGVGCRAPAGTQPVYRSLFGNKHFYSLLLREGLMAGLAFETTAFTTFNAPGDGRVAVYRCRAAGPSYFVSLDARCEGQAVEGPLGYVQAAPQAGLVPLYRSINAASGDHLATLIKDEGAPYYKVEQTLGYVPSL